jgi:hypothetical protein
MSEQEVITLVKELQDENSILNSAVINFSAKNQELAEHIRVALNDILAVAKDLRDCYSDYARFIQNTVSNYQQEVVNADSKPTGTESP